MISHLQICSSAKKQSNSKPGDRVMSMQVALCALTQRLAQAGATRRTPYGFHDPILWENLGGGGWWEGGKIHPEVYSILLQKITFSGLAGA